MERGDKDLWEEREHDRFSEWRRAQQKTDLTTAHTETIVVISKYSFMFPFKKQEVEKEENDELICEHLKTEFSRELQESLEWV